MPQLATELPSLRGTYTVHAGTRTMLPAAQNGHSTAHSIDSDLLEQMGFMHREISRLFPVPDNLPPYSSSLRIEWYTKEGFTRPVYTILTPGVNELVFIGGENQWAVSADLQHTVPDVFYHLFDKARRVNARLTPGFQKRWVHRAFRTDQAKFSATIKGGNYAFYAFCFLLSESLSAALGG